MLLLGVDTLEFGIEVEDYEHEFRCILNTFQLLKTTAQETGEECEITIGDVTLKVHSSGIRFYAYRLTCADFTICFAEKQLPNNAPISVRFMSGYLWSFTLKGSIEHFIEWFSVFDSKIITTKVSRADICTDTDEVSFIPRDGNDFITRAKSKSRHGVDDDHSDGKIFNGFTIGRGQPMLGRIYHKGLEIKKSGKAWFYDVWSLHDWSGQTAVWRVEFQLRRQVLKEMGISTVDDFTKNIDGIWAYCTREWLTLRRPNGEDNVTRWPIRRKWLVIQTAKFHQLTTPLVREKVRQGNLTQLMNQASGLAVSIAALGDRHSLDETFQVLGHWTEERLRKKNTSFDGEKENRRNRFLR